MSVHVPFVTKGSSPLDVPLVAFFKMLRVDSIDDMMAYIFPEGESNPYYHTVRRALDVSTAMATREEIIQWLCAEGTGSMKAKERISAEKKHRYIRHVFASEVCPHVGTVGCEYYEEEEEQPAAEQFDESEDVINEAWAKHPSRPNLECSSLGRIKLNGAIVAPTSDFMVVLDEEELFVAELLLEAFVEPRPSDQHVAEFTDGVSSNMGLFDADGEARIVWIEDKEAKRKKRNKPSPNEEKKRWSGSLWQHRRKRATKEQVDAECHRKCIFVGTVIVKLINVHFKNIPSDDRDHMVCKRFDTPGPLLAYLFRLNFRGFLRQLPAALAKATAASSPSSTRSRRGARASRTTCDSRSSMETGACRPT